VEFEAEAISRRLVIELLERLSPLQREVVVLRFIAGMRSVEVAASLGKSEGAVVQLQLRGLRRMRKELAKE
jgi:RNA polymerase sigma-70 factor (ECF subfamily)